uniref:Uncharacterized protein n=1 Tax=Knipowitschia caucasica TaxID=637954 RepID=A0AAV2K687_KNICA
MRREYLGNDGPDIMSRARSAPELTTRKVRRSLWEWWTGRTSETEQSETARLREELAQVKSELCEQVQNNKSLQQKLEERKREKDRHAASLKDCKAKLKRVMAELAESEEAVARAKIAQHRLLKQIREQEMILCDARAGFHEQWEEAKVEHEKKVQELQQQLAESNQLLEQLNKEKEVSQSDKEKAHATLAKLQRSSRGSKY